MFEKYVKYGILFLGLLTLLPGTSNADLADMSHLDDDTEVVEASVGYRFLDTDGNANRAAEYLYLDDSATFDLVYKKDLGNKYFTITGDFNNKNDYLFQGSFNYKALIRLEAMTERLYHNLDHIPYNTAVLDARQTSGEADYFDLDTNANYGRRVTIDEVKVRGKLPTYPAHINLSVWRMEKKGHEQLRFVDENCAASCHMSSTTRRVDRITEEVKAGIDAHLGPVDIAFLQTLREFKEKAANPVDTFGPHAFGRAAAQYDHDVTPDSKLTESTFMVNLPPSGGFVTSASYTLGKRENNSSITGVSPTDTETDYQKLAADVTYTPGERWTVNLRYRMFDLDSDVPSIQTSTGTSAFGGNIPVRESINIDRDSYAAYISYRPSHRSTIKGEFEREVVERSGTGDRPFDRSSALAAQWDLPSRETADRYRLSFHKRMLDKNALKLHGWYEHVNVDNPAYGTTLTDSNELFFSANYKPSMHWGASTSIDILDGAGRGRDKNSENFALGMWFMPNEIFSADINYGLMNSNTDEEIEFGEAAFNIHSDADYDQTIHTLSAGINIRPADKINCRLEGYHIRSQATFDPTFVNTTANAATDDDLKEISEVDIRQNGFKARLSWKLTEILTAGIEYTFDDYDDRNASTFDGSAQTVLASLTGTF